MIQKMTGTQVTKIAESGWTTQVTDKSVTRLQHRSLLKQNNMESLYSNQVYDCNERTDQIYK